MGFGTYRFKYLWSEQAYIAVLAQEVVSKVPDAVITGPGKLLAVDYAKLGTAMKSEAAPGA